MELWHCSRCRKLQPAQLENGHPKVRRFMNGFIAVQLTCNHWARVRLDKAPARPLTIPI
jgi:hypothetical protein